MQLLGFRFVGLLLALRKALRIFYLPLWNRLKVTYFITPSNRVSAILYPFQLIIWITQRYISVPISVGFAFGGTCADLNIKCMICRDELEIYEEASPNYRGSPPKSVSFSTSGCLAVIWPTGIDASSLWNICKASEKVYLDSAQLACNDKSSLDIRRTRLRLAYSLPSFFPSPSLSCLISSPFVANHSLPTRQGHWKSKELSSRVWLEQLFFKLWCCFL